MLRHFAPDFGMALARLGLAENSTISLFPARLNMFAKIDDDLLSASANVIFSDRPHCVSFDFDSKLLPELVAGLPRELSDLFIGAIRRSPFVAAAELAIELDLDTKLGPEVIGTSETFRPLIIERVIAARFDPAPHAEEATDIPPNVFRLRKAYVWSP